MENAATKLQMEAKSYLDALRGSYTHIPNIEIHIKRLWYALCDCRKFANAHFCNFYSYDSIANAHCRDY